MINRTSIVSYEYTDNGCKLHSSQSEYTRSDVREAVNQINPNAVLPECWPKDRIEYNSAELIKNLLFGWTEAKTLTDGSVRLGCEFVQYEL